MRLMVALLVLGLLAVPVVFDQVTEPVEVNGLTPPQILVAFQQLQVALGPGMATFAGALVSRLAPTTPRMSSAVKTSAPMVAERARSWNLGLVFCAADRALGLRPIPSSSFRRELTLFGYAYLSTNSTFPPLRPVPVTKEVAVQIPFH